MIANMTSSAEEFAKVSKNMSAFSSTVLTFAFCFFGFKVFTFFLQKLKTFDLKNTLSRGGVGLFFGSPQDIMETVMRYLDKAEPTPYTFWLGYVHYVLIDKPEDLQVVLNNSNCLEKSNFYKFFINTVGEGLFSSPETTMDYDINELESTKVEFEEALKKASVEDSLRIYKPWLHPDFIFNLYVKLTGLSKSYELVHKLPEQIIKRKQMELREHKLKFGNTVRKEKFTKSFLDLLLELNEDGAEFSDTDIRDEVVTMMIGGSETSALTISFTLFMLAMNADIQQKAYEEIEKILGNDDRPITIEDVNKMTYLEQCIRETLRMFPPGPLILRRATKDVILSDNFVLRSGANVIIPPIKVQRHPKIYENPLIWNPDNFSVEQVAKRHKYSFIAFSGGPRGCIGSKYAMFSMKVTVTMILREFILSTDVKFEDIKLRLDLLMRSVHGYKIKLNARKSKES